MDDFSYVRFNECVQTFHEHMVFYPANHDSPPPVMASEARPSICEARGDGLPRFARRDGIFGLLFKVCVR